MLNRENLNRKKYGLPPVGMRILKTMLSCLLVALCYKYFLNDRNPCFACIGAVYAMGSHFHEGFKNGFNRFVGTLMGGLLAIPIYWLSINNILGLPEWSYMMIGLFFVIYLNVACGSNNAIQPGTVIYFVVLYTQHQDSYITYTLARIIDTGIGAMISLGLTMLLPSSNDQSSSINLSEAILHWYNSNQRPSSEQHHILEGNE